MSDKHDEHSAGTEREHTLEADGQTPVRPDGSADGGPVTAPIVIDVGKQRRRLIRQLARGEGPLMTEVHDIIDAVRAELGDGLDGKTLVPLVIICRPKRRRRRSEMFPTP